MNKDLFQGSRGLRVPEADTTNAARGRAITLDPKTAIAQFAMTATFPEAGTFYSTAEQQLGRMIEYAAAAGDDSFIAKLAAYARHKGKMKDAPVVLLALLMGTHPEHAAAILPTVADSPAQLKKLVQVMRSGITGRKSLGSRPKRLITQQLHALGLGYIVARGLVGNNPSLTDVVKMLHPKPPTDEWRAFYGWLLKKDHDANLLPEALKALEAFKASPATADIPKGIEFLQLTSLIGEHPERWADLLPTMSWTQVFKTLATWSRHGAFALPDFEEMVITKLRDEAHVRNSRQFPYALYKAHKTVSQIGSGVGRTFGARPRGEAEPRQEDPLPRMVVEAVSDCVDYSVANAPALPGVGHMLVDVSGSMGAPIGSRHNFEDFDARAREVTRSEMAGLFAASSLKANPASRVIAFGTSAAITPMSAKDSVVTLAEQAADNRNLQHGTNMDAAFQRSLGLAMSEHPPAYIVVFSDMQTWADSRGQAHRRLAHSRSGTPSHQTLREIQHLAEQAGMPKTLVVNWNLAGDDATSQMVGDDVLNVAGYSDALWDAVAAFLRGEGDGTVAARTVTSTPDPDVWIKEIEALPLDREALAEWVESLKVRT